MDRDAEPVTELQRKGLHLIGEAELARFRPNGRDLVGRNAGAHQVDRGIDPFAALLVGVLLHVGGHADVEGAVIAGPVAGIGVQDVEERLVAGAHHAVGEVVRMRVATLARNGVDGFDIVGAHLVEHFVGLSDDVVFANAGF